MTARTKKKTGSSSIQVAQPDPEGRPDGVGCQTGAKTIDGCAGGSLAIKKLMIYDVSQNTSHLEKVFGPNIFVGGKT